MAATVRADWYGGAASEPAGVTAETGITFARADSQAPSSGTSPVPVPTATGTNYSWIKLLALNVTTGDSTSISNRTIRLASAIDAGLHLFFKQQATYDQPDSGNKPADNGTTDAATPSGYTLMSTSAQTYDSGSDSASSTGRSGDFCELVFGVDTDYGGGAGQASLPNLTVGYDEA